jgi:uncharacterized protein
MQNERHPTPVRGLRRIVFLLFAGLFFALGAIGAVLPGIPTTPFLLLMSYFLLRSSPKLYDRVLRIPFVGRVLDDWHRHRAVQWHIKVLATLTVLTVVVISAWSSALAVSSKTTIAILAAIGLWIVWRLPTRS